MKYIRTPFTALAGTAAGVPAPAERRAKGRLRILPVPEPENLSRRLVCLYDEVRVNTAVVRRRVSTASARRARVHNPDLRSIRILASIMGCPYQVVVVLDRADYWAF
jgi:hypothetical protein